MPEDGSEQPLVGYRSNEEWQDLMAQAALMVGALDEIEDDETRNKVFAAMAGIDAVHREALHRLVESYLALGIVDEAQNAAAVLGYNFPGSDWYVDSYALLTGERLKATFAEESWLSRNFRKIIGGDIF